MRRGTPAAGVAGTLPRIVLADEDVDSVEIVCAVASGLLNVELMLGIEEVSSLIGDGLRPAERPDPVEEEWPPRPGRLCFCSSRAWTAAFSLAISASVGVRALGLPPRLPAGLSPPSTSAADSFPLASLSPVLSSVLSLVVSVSSVEDCTPACASLMSSAGERTRGGREEELREGSCGRVGAPAGSAWEGCCLGVARGGCWEEGRDDFIAEPRASRGARRCISP